MAAEMNQEHGWEHGTQVNMALFLAQRQAPVLFGFDKRTQSEEEQELRLRMIVLGGEEVIATHSITVILTQI